MNSSDDNDDNMMMMTDNKNNNNNNNNDDIENKNDSSDLGPIYLHRWLDCQDEYNKWYEAQIIAISPNNNKNIKVHYKGWKSKFDTWIDLNTEPERARLLHTFTDKPIKLGELNNYDIGTKCDCLDSTDKWYQAQIMEINQNGKLVRVHYIGWDEKYDEWINKDSYRIAPLHTMTSPIKPKSNNNNKQHQHQQQQQQPPQQQQQSNMSPHKSSKRRNSGNVSIKRKPKFKRTTSDNSNSSVRINKSPTNIGAYASSADDLDHDTSNQNITVLSDNDYDYKKNTEQQQQQQQQQSQQTTEIKDEDNDDDDDDDNGNIITGIDNNQSRKPDEVLSFCFLSCHYHYLDVV